MAKYKGKDFLVLMDISGTYTVIGGCKESGISRSHEMIDVTDKQGAPDRELLEGGVRSMSVSISGMTSDNAAFKTFVSRAHEGTKHNFRITSGLGDKYQGEFQITSFERNGALAEEPWTATLESSGAIAYTPAP